MERTDENELTLYYYDVTISHRIQIPSAGYTFRKGNVLGGLILKDY
jgi:hypothetical protein